MKERIAMAAHACDAACQNAPVAQKTIPEIQRERGLEHIAAERQKARSEAEDPRHIGRSGVPAAGLPHVTPEAELAEQDRRAQRTQEITDDDHDHVFEYSHADPSIKCVFTVFTIRRQKRLFKRIA